MMCVTCQKNKVASPLLQAYHTFTRGKNGLIPLKQEIFLVLSKKQ